MESFELHSSSGKRWYTSPRLISVEEDATELTFSDGGVYTAALKRKRFRLLLESSGEIVASATRSGVLGRRFSIDCAGDRWTLRRQGLRGRSGRIVRDSREKGSIEARYAHAIGRWHRVEPYLKERVHEGSFSGSMNLDERLPLPVTALALCLTLGSWLSSPPKTGTWIQTRNISRGD